MDRLNILIVDDEPLVGDLIRRKLSGIEPRFVIAMVQSAYDCIEHMAGSRVDCVLSDYQMPGMDGMELLDRLRKSGDQTPFIFVTGQGSEEVAREAFKHGAYDYFTKEVGFAHFDRISNSMLQAVKHRRAEDHRLMAEMGLAEEKNKLDAVISAIGDGICIIDRGYKAVFYNEAYRRIIGGHIGEECFKAIQGRVSICDDCPVELTLRDGRVHRARKRVVVDGAEKFVELSASPLKDHKGEVVAVVKLVREITEQIEYERRLADSERKYRAMFEDSPMPMMVFDRQTLDFLGVNEAAVEHYGYSREELLSMNFMDIHSPEDVPGVVELLAEIPPGLTRVGVWRHRKKDGTAISVDVSTHPIEFEGRDARLVLACDVTDRIRSEEALMESEGSYRMLSSNLPGIVYRIYLRENNRMRFFNDHMSSITGYDPGELGNGEVCYIENLMLPEDRGRVLEVVGRTIEDRSAFEVEYRIRRKDGELRYLSERGALILGDDGEPLYIDGVIMDVSRRKTLEKNREELFQMLRHDMKTPLSVISGSAEMILLENGSRLDAGTIKMLETIKSGAQSLSSMMEDLMAISSLETAGHEVYMEATDVLDLLVEISLVASEGARSAGLEYTKNIAGGLPEMAVNRLYIQRALTNLIDNAVKYTPRGGKVSLSAGLFADNGRRFLDIAVSDTGPGIPKDEQGRVFEKYYRSPNVQPGSGSGLGLAIVKAVADIHGGCVKLESALGEGSTFTLRLPVEGGR